MSILEDLLSRMSQSDQIKGYLNKLNDSLFLIKRCVVILVFLAGLTVFLTEWLWRHLTTNLHRASCAYPLAPLWPRYTIAKTTAKKTKSIMSSIISISCLITPLHKRSARTPYPNITSAMITVPIACNSRYVSNSICRSSRIVVQALTIEPRLWLSFLTLLTPTGLISELIPWF